MPIRPLIAGLLLLAATDAVLAAEAIRPLYSRPAQTASAPQLDAFVEYFDGLKLQEAIQLEGWTAGFDFTLPLNPSMQLRVMLPVRTEADAVLIDGGDDIHIEGWGGTFQFGSVFFEHQLKGVDGGPDRVAWFAGIGHRTAVLKTGTPDKYNHRGRSLHGGFRFDRSLASGGAWLMDLELRFYETSDDLHPGNQLDDNFFLGSVRGGWFSAPRGAFTPGLEAVLDLASGHVAASIVPEVIIRGSEALDLKFGVPIGLTADAPNLGAQFRLTVQF